MEREQCRHEEEQKEERARVLENRKAVGVAGCPVLERGTNKGRLLGGQQGPEHAGPCEPW